MFKRLEVRIVAITEARDELEELQQHLDAATRGFDTSHAAAIRVAQSLEPQTDAQVYADARDLGLDLSQLGLLPDGTRAQLSFDFD
jgi:hypothetical protein